MARKLKILFCRIDGAPIYEYEVPLIAICILGLSIEEMALFIGTDENEIKKMRSALYDRLNAANVQRLNRKAELWGFDIFGNYNGTPVFSPREIKLLLKIAPWLELYPGRAA